MKRVDELHQRRLAAHAHLRRCVAKVSRAPFVVPRRRLPSLPCPALTRCGAVRCGRHARSPHRRRMRRPNPTARPMPSAPRAWFRAQRSPGPSQCAWSWAVRSSKPRSFLAPTGFGPLGCTSLSLSSAAAPKALWEGSKLLLRPFQARSIPPTERLLVSASGATVGKAGADDAEEVAWPADGLRASVMRRTDANRLELQFEVDGCVWTGVRSLSEFKWLAQARRLVRPHAQPCVEPRNGLDCGCRAAVRLTHPYYRASLSRAALAAARAADRRAQRCAGDAELPVRRRPRRARRRGRRARARCVPCRPPLFRGARKRGPRAPVGVAQAGLRRVP